MKNVLIPTDFSNNSLNACEYALQFFKNESCNFHLLHVVKPNGHSDTNTYQKTDIAIAEIVDLKAVTQKLQSLVHNIRVNNKNERHRFFALVDYEYFVDAVRKQLQEKDIDLIVMGTKGSSEIKRMSVGSNTSDIITKVQCTTLIIPENCTYKIPKAIVFPSDFSTSYSVQIFEPLLEILEKTKASLHALYVNGNTEEPLQTQQKTNKAYFADCFHNTKLYFHDLADKTFNHGINTFTNNRNIDMIVLNAKKLNFFHQIFFKENVEASAVHTNTPFLILHE